MSIKLKLAEANQSFTPWRNITAIKLKLAEANQSFTPWRNITSAFLKTDNGWRRFFGAGVLPTIESRVTISSNNTTFPAVLTGTNFRWSNSTSLSFEFQRSENQVSWTTCSGTGATGSITNPVTSNTRTYTIVSADMSAGSVYFRFVVDAVNTNSTPPTTSSSASTAVEILSPQEPEVNAYPFLSGNAAALSVLSSIGGSYTNASSITTQIVATTSPDLLTQASTVDPYSAVKGTSTYTVTQSDATTTSFHFLARDVVVALNGTTYYYYSPAIKSNIRNVTDNFNRTVSGGLGTMSSEFIYSGGATSPAWSVNGSAAVSSATPTAVSGPNTWGLRSIEMGGKTNITMSVSVPGNVGGVGLAFWVTGNSNWWSAICYQAPETITSYECTGTQQTSTNDPGSEGTGAGAVCNKTTFNTFACNQAGSSSSSYPSNVGTGSGQVCNVIETTSYACNQPGGSSTTNPGSEGTGPGAVCNLQIQFNYDCLSQVYSQVSDPGALGSGPGAVCFKTEVYDCNFSSVFSSRTDPGSESSGSNGICVKSTSTGYEFVRFDTTSAPTQATVSTCNANNVGRAQTGSITFGSFGNVTGWNRCQAFTLYSWYRRSVGVSSYSYRLRSTAISSTQHTWNTRTTTPTTTYSWNTRSSTATVNYNWRTRETSTTTLYGTSLNIYEANGTSISLKNTNLIDANSIGYLSVDKINLSTNGDTISADLRNSSNVLLGTATSYTPSSPTKTGTAGLSSFGISKGHSPASNGNQFDNLSIN